MKKINQLLIAFGILVILLSSSQSHAVVPLGSADATANAKVVKPIKITWGKALNFGIFTSPSTDGTIVMDAWDGTHQPTQSNWQNSFTGNTPRVIPAGNSQLVNTAQFGASAGNPGPATFQVNGEPGFFYHVILPPLNQTVSVTPAIITLNNTGGPPQMTLTDFTISIDPTLGQLDAVGRQFFGVGATLHVNANQACGPYTGTFDVSVAYN